MASSARWVLVLILLQSTIATRGELGLGDNIFYHGVRRRESGQNPSESGKHNNYHRSNGEVVVADEASSLAGIEELLVVRGQEVVLDCVVEEKVSVYSDDGVVTWYHDDNEVAEDLRLSITWSGRLVMSHVIEADSGVWSCSRGLHDGQPKRLLVTIPPERPFLVYGGAPLAMGARLTTREGNALTLNCVVDGGNPAPDVSWMLGDKDITPTSQVVSTWISEEGTFSTMSNVTVSAVDKDMHNNTLTCIVHHPALPIPHHVPLRLNIEYPPDFRLRRWPSWGTPVRAGASVALFCLVDSNPPSPPFWFKETGGHTEELGMSEQGWLNLTQVTSADRGWYKCATTYEDRNYASHSVFINVQPAGELQVAPPSVVEVGVGETVQIPCTTPTSSLPLSICWTKLLEGGRVAGVQSGDALVLRKTSYADGGKYRCLASDHHSTKESQDVEIKVTGGPIVEAVNTSVLAISGRSTAVSAHICGVTDSSQVSWLPPNHVPLLKAGQRHNRFRAHNLTASSSSPGCSYAVLTIVDLQGDDAGDWVVVGVNSFGAHATLIRLNVTTAAPSVAASSATVHKGLTALVVTLSLAVIFTIHLLSTHPRGWG
ncbi:unnamed protein product [Meganyctiphanes norvegica]|uniref:Ig-like domain-containing protein n=1 Tax=Meganyctiphanes norvegica TaxID=48144 RepID=A0AAV2PSV4_MEGNR